MADNNLRQMVQQLIDSGKSEEEIVAALKGGAGGVSRAADERPPFDAEAEGMMALGRRPDINAAAAAAGTAPFAGPALPGMIRSGAQGLLSLAENPIVGGLTGAYHGYKRNGLPGAIAEGLAGAATAGGVGKLGGFLRAATQAKEAEAAALAAKAAPSIIRSSTPGLGQMFGREATGQAVQQAESAALRNQLLHELRAR